MNPNFNYAIVAARMQALQAEADAATRARLARRHSRVLAFAPVGSGR